MNLELFLTKYASKFINPRHEKKAIQGILFDGEGFAYATDGFQAIRVSGFPVDGEI